MSGDSKSRTISESLVLDDSEKGVIITGITDDTIAAKSGLKAGDEIVEATVHLDHLNKNEVLNILKVLESYDNNMKVLTKNKDLSATAGLGSLGLGLKDPTEMLNQKKDLSLDASAEGPVVSLGQSGNLNAAQGLGGEISIPTLNGNLSGLSKPSADAGAKFTMPSLGLTGPDIKGDLDGTLKAPDVSVSSPQLNTPSTSLNIEKPEMKTGELKYQPPKFTMPHFNNKTMDIDPKFDSKNTDLDMNLSKVELNGPDVNLETPNANIEAPSGKFKWPHLKWKGPKVKGPDADLNADLSAPDASLSTPKIDGDLSAPDVDINLPKADLPTLNPDIDAPSGKVNWPHLKWKKPKLHNQKADLDFDANLNTPDVDLAAPKVEGEINAPDADISLPKVDLKGPGLDMQTPDIDGETPSGKINWPHLKWKKGKYPKADIDIDPNLNTPDLSTPKIESDINVPSAELNLPKADLKGPDVDVNAPHLDIDAPSSKMNWPHLKWKKNKLQGPKADMDLNADLSTPDVDLSVPKIDGGISTPDVDPNLPTADIGAPSSKIRFPTLKKPKFQFSGTKGKLSDVDLHADMKALDQASLDLPDGDLNVPKADVDVKAPNVDIEHQSGKFKWPTLKKPKWSVSGPKVNSPDVDIDADVSAPDLSVSTPKVEGAINAPDANINLPKTDLEGPKLDINSPDIDSPSGKLKWFNFKKPKFGTLKGPKADIDADVKVPDVHLKASDVDLNAPDVNLSGQKIGIDSPDLNISVPTANVKGPDVDLNGLDLDINSPKADLKGLDADLQAPEIVSLPMIPNMKLPKSGLSGPTAKGPNLNVDADLKSPGLDLSAPTIKGDVSTPDLGLDADLKTGIPKANISVPMQSIKDVDPNLSKADVKGASLDLPKADLKVPNLSLSSGKSELPNAELQTNDVTLKAPKGDFDSHLGDFKFPHSKFPNLDFSSPEVEVPTVHPSVESIIKAPQVNKTTPSADANLSVPVVDLSAPKAEGDIKLPEAGSIAPTVDVSHEKSKMPHFKLPKFNLSGSNIKAPEVDTSANLEVSPDVKVKAPSVEGEISTPHVSGSAPEMKTSLDTPELDITAEADTEVKGSPKSKIKWPFKWGLKSGSGTDEEGSGADSETDVSTAEVEVPTFKFHRLPTSNVNGNGGFGDTFGLPKLDTMTKDYVVSKGVRLPIVNATSKAGEKIDIMERLKIAKDKVPSTNISPTEEKTDIDLKLNAPSLDVSASTEAGDSLVRGGTFKLEKPESVLGLVAPEISTSDENDKMSLSLSNMLGLNIKDSDAE
ncbi:uncharacterized protein LOC143328264 [Chaetodon auriga]|uniref:uncharacterized protein LOC143328264 n=1 Tax=Chaetodon auriga TaxID=39042 RepID=UPI004032DA32